VPGHHAVPERLRRRIFLGSWAVRTGVLTAGQLRGPGWRRLFRDVYVDAAVPDTHRLRARAAAGLVVPGAVVTGASAAVLWGADLVGVADDVELTVPPGSHPRRHPGLVVRRTLLPDADVRVHAGVRVSTPEATVLRLARVLPRDDAVVAADRLVRATGIDLEALRERVGAPGAVPPRVRTVCALADGLAESPPETRVRLLLRAGRCRSRWPSTRSGTGETSWPGSTSRGRSTRSPWSTTAPGTATGSSSRGTDGGSTVSRRRDGASSS